MDITSKLPPMIQDAYSDFYSSLEDDMQRMNQAVKDASNNQDNSDPSAQSS